MARTLGPGPGDELKSTPDAARRWPIVPAAVLAAVVLAAFLPALAAGFAPLDDDQNFIYNLSYRGLGWHQLGWMLTTRHLGHYIPLSWMSLGLDYLVWGMDPLGYHLTNILIHLLNALLCLQLARMLLRRAWEPPAGDWATTAGAYAAALVFAVHPLRVESVVWITERRDVLCGTFVLLTVLLYVAMTGARGRRRLLLLAGSCLLYAAALLAKGIAVALPVSLLALDATVLRRRWWGREPAAPGAVAGEGAGELDGAGAAWQRSRVRWALVAEKVPYLLLAAAGAAAALWSSEPVRANSHGLQLGERLAAAAYGLIFYLRATVAPVHLPFFIPWPEEVGLTRPAFALRALLVVVLAVVLWTLRRRAPALVAAAVSYAAWVLPVSGLFQAGPQMAAHRYSYLSCLPWALLAGAGVVLLARRHRVLVAVGVAVLTVLLAAATRRQALLWSNAQSFSSAAAASSPDFWLTRYQRAHSEVEAGDWRAAAAEVDAGLHNTPDARRLAALGALMLATCPDPAVRNGDEALDLAMTAVEAGDPPDQFSLYALAAAQAETGDFAAAILTSGEGLDHPDENADLPLARRFADAIALFKLRRPLRFGPADWPY
jgi:hypothetical protein